METTKTTRALIVVFSPAEVGVGAIDDVLAHTPTHARATTRARTHLPCRVGCGLNSQRTVA